MQELNISLGQNGRIVIPASIRKSLGLKQGQRLRLHLDNQKIVLEKTDDVIQKLQHRFGFIKQSLSKELIQERRQEAMKEDS
ncbi:MAG: AbrB/MazE/SpoVT family DNA-binding domain-containing protein [Gammaproteobacteria bacterium]|nr:AbrB/MazE/SpoVT family DNA-binding domain-containing protein [Gammaproteobacteria bacterium]